MEGEGFYLMRTNYVMLYSPINEVVRLGVPRPGGLIEDDEAISLHYLLLLDVVLPQKGQTVGHLLGVLVLLQLTELGEISHKL